MARTIKIGRSRESDVVLTDPTVSRQHGELIIRADGRIVFTDVGSSGGSFIVLEDGLLDTTGVGLERTDTLLLGGYEVTVGALVEMADAELLNARVEGMNDQTTSGSGYLEVKVTGNKRRGFGQGQRAMRDPKTGQIIRKT